MKKKRATNARDPVDGKYIRNISEDDDFRLRLPKNLVRQLRLHHVKKLAIFINERNQIVIEPYFTETKGTVHHEY